MSWPANMLSFLLAQTNRIPDPAMALILGVAVAGSKLAEVVTGVGDSTLTLAVTIVGALWWLSARLQRGDDTMIKQGEILKEQRKIIEDHGDVLLALTQSIQAIGENVKKLPCKSECDK